MKLRAQQIVLIALPLIFEIGIGVYLMYMLRQSHYDSLEAKFAKSVLFTSSELLRNEGEELWSIMLMQTSDSDFAQNRLQKFKSLRDHSRKELLSLAASNPKIQESATAVADSADLVQAYLDECARLASEGQRIDFRENLAQCRVALMSHIEKVDLLTSPFRGVEIKAKSRQEKALRNVELGLGGAVVLSILLAASLVAYVNRGIIRRFTILMENITRLSNSEELLQPLAGTDEIATIDQTFHRMAAIIESKTEALKQSESHVRAILEGLPLGVIVADREMLVRYANSEVGSYLATDPGKLQGVPLQSLIEKQASLETSFGDRKKVRLNDSRLRFENASLAAEITIVHLNESEDNAYIAGVLDITERKMLEQIRNDFIAMLTHDLRTPLTAMQLNLDLLLSARFGELNERGRKAVESDQKNCKYLISLVNEILDIEKMQSGNFVLTMELCRVKDLLAEATSAILSLARTKDLTLEVFVDDESELIVDRERFVRVLINLLSNAIKFSPEAGVIQIEGTVVDSHFQISLSDEGPGIPEEMREAVFDKYVQLNSSHMAERRPGTGLGLAICKSVIEAHQGTIKVEPAKGKSGSVFLVSLPLPQCLEEELESDTDVD